MGVWALAVCIILYLVVALDYLFKKDYAHCGAWIFYALANVCFLWHLWELKGK